MVIYCFKCKLCGNRVETNMVTPVCCDTDMGRDYRAESVGVGSGVRVSRTGTNLDQARLFLPGNDEFKGPGDPDGKKGAREWLDTHQPKESGGNNPLLEIERRSF